MWDLEQQRCVETVVGHRAEVWDFCVTPEQDRLVTISSAADMKVWKLRSLEDVDDVERKEREEREEREKCEQCRRSRGSRGHCDIFTLDIDGTNSSCRYGTWCSSQV